MSSSTRSTQSQVPRRYWYYSHLGTTTLEKLNNGEDHVEDFVQSVEKRHNTFLHRLEVYRFKGDVTEGQILGNAEPYFQAHLAEFTRLNRSSPLPSPRGTDSDGIALLDFFLRLPPSPASPDLEVRDNLADLPTTRYKALNKYALNCKVPSEGSKAKAYKDEQGRANPEERFFDGRYDNDHPQSNVGAPIQIFHNCFADFEHETKTVQVTSEDMVKVATLFDKSSAIYANEDERLKAITPCLEDILGFSLLKVQNVDKTAPDATHSFDIQMDSGGGTTRVVLTLWEAKDEFGRGGSSPDVQAQLSVRRTWFQSNSVVAANRCCCPTFILATRGPYLMVLGATITGTVAVNRLTPWLPIVNVSHDIRPYEEIARTLVALRNVVESLTDFWKKLPIPENPHVPSPSRFLPWRTSYYSAKGEEIPFVYVHALEDDPSTVTFLARHTSGDMDKIVIKFVATDRYGDAAHKLLADEGFAPPLLYNGPLSSSCSWLSMIVMGHVDGKTLCERHPPPGFHAQIKQALECLHESNLVFGDLRKQNIMVDSEDKLKLIDFNWVGVEGKTKYPYNMNMEMETGWAAGMGRGKVMQKKHDMDMLKKLNVELV